MALEHVHSFLVHPSKGEQEQPPIGGTSVRLPGPLGKMLVDVFERASTECDIEIVFRPNDAGEQRNECRDLLVAYVGDPTVPHGRKIADRLQAITTHRSGLGLLFLMQGTSNSSHKLVVSRFPADQGVIAEENRDRLSVEFIERVFMKSAKAYKSAFYQSDSLDRGFWDGHAVDRQISGPKELSDYWIRDFLVSELRTTGPAGTKRIAVAIRTAIRSTEALDTRQELIAATSLLRGQHGRRVSGDQLIERLGLSEDAAKALEAALPRPDLMKDVFQFDRDEFERHVLYRLVELDNGAMLLAEDAEFENVFQTTAVDQSAHRFRYATEGQVVDTQLRKSK